MNDSGFQLRLRLRLKTIPILTALRICSQTMARLLTVSRDPRPGQLLRLNPRLLF